MTPKVTAKATVAREARGPDAAEESSGAPARRALAEELGVESSRRRRKLGRAQLKDERELRAVVNVGELQRRAVRAGKIRGPCSCRTAAATTPASA